jgi:hypothetical protein
MPEVKFTEDQCCQLDQVLQSIAYTKQLIAQCKDCSLDMSRYEEELAMQEKLAAGYKRNFAPHRP